MRESLLIHIDYCLTPSTRINNAAIVIRDHKIHAVGGYSAFVHPENYDIIELSNCYAIPGFIDTHISGAGRFDCMHANTDPNFEQMSIALAEHGVTSFCPTTHTSAHGHLLGVIEALRDTISNPRLPGAIPFGFHVDGPFISIDRRGAHQEKYIKPIDLGMAREIVETGGGHIKIFTYAPELANAIKLTELLCEHQISPCMGHTVADEDEVLMAIDAGADRCLHLYNGMEPLQQRRVSLAAIAMTDQRLWVEIIPDGVHSHWGMLELACRCKSKEKLIAVSNATEAAGLPDGRYHLGDRIILVEHGRVTLKDGTIAGSTSFLDRNYRNLLEHSHLSQEEAAACCSLNPAKSIGASDRGRIKPGKRADLVILNKDTHEVELTIVNGRLAYSRLDRTMLIKNLPAPKPEEG